MDFGLIVDEDEQMWIRGLILDPEFILPSYPKDELYSVEKNAVIPLDFDFETLGTLANPIPVYGRYGELTYLSKLRDSNGNGFFFHKIEEINEHESFRAQPSISVYHLLSFDGRRAENLHLAPGSTFQCDAAPPYFTLSSELGVFTGVPWRTRNFPFSMVDDLPPRLSRLKDAFWEQKERWMFASENQFLGLYGELDGHFNCFGWSDDSHFREFELNDELVILWNIGMRDPSKPYPQLSETNMLRPNQWEQGCKGEQPKVFGVIPSTDQERAYLLNQKFRFEPLVPMVSQALSFFLEYRDPLEKLLLAPFRGIKPSEKVHATNTYFIEFRVCGNYETLTKFSEFLTDLWGPSHSLCLRVVVHRYEFCGENGAHEYTIQVHWSSEFRQENYFEIAQTSIFERIDEWDCREDTLFYLTEKGEISNEEMSSYFFDCSECPRNWVSISLTATMQSFVDPQPGQAFLPGYERYSKFLSPIEQLLLTKKKCTTCVGLDVAIANPHIWETE